MVQFLIVFIIILLFLILIWWMLKNRKIPWMKFQAKDLKHIEGLSLGMNISVHIIKYKDKCFLIGCTPNSIVLLKEIQDEACEE